MSNDSYFMKDQVDPKKKIHNILWRNFTEFFSWPSGVVAAGIQEIPEAGKEPA